MSAPLKVLAIAIDLLWTLAAAWALRVLLLKIWPSVSEPVASGIAGVLFGAVFAVGVIRVVSR